MLNNFRTMNYLCYCKLKLDIKNNNIKYSVFIINQFQIKHIPQLRDQLRNELLILKKILLNSHNKKIEKK